MLCHFNDSKKLQDMRSRRRLNPFFFFKYMILSNSDTIGELIEESRGKITGERVLDVEISKMESSLQWK
jgi:hypothetical protein